MSCGRGRSGFYQRVRARQVQDGTLAPDRLVSESAASPGAACLKSHPSLRDKEHVTGVDQLLREALSRAAASLQGPEPTHLLEKDLKSAVKGALTELIQEGDQPFRVGPMEHRLSMSGFQGVGTVDVAIYDSASQPTALSLIHI